MSSLSPPAAEAFHVVVLYERSPLVGKAMATCSHLRHELGDAFALDFRLWRIDLATSVEFAAQADRDIDAADVIVIGVAGNEPCPPAFRRWRETALARGRNGPHAIIAIAEGADEPGPAGETWNNVLRDGATQIHPEIFVCEPLEAPVGAAGEPEPAEVD